MIHGQAVTLRPITPDDARHLAAYLDADTLMLLGRIGEAPTEDVVIDWWTTPSTTARRFAIVVDTMPVGYVALSGINLLHGHAEIGIAIPDPRQRGKRYGTAAVRLLCQWGIDALGLHTILAVVFGYNTASLRAFHAAGFVEAGRLRAYVKARGERWDSILLQWFSGSR